MKKLISLFLLFIISIQCMPAKELGKSIFEQSFVEDDDINNNVEKKESKQFFKEFFFSKECSVWPTFSKVIVFHFKSINLYESPLADLSIQPPNT